MTMPPIGASLTIDLGEEEENALLLEIATEWADELYETIDDAYPHLIMSPGVHLTGRDAFERFMLRIVEAYPTDPIGRQNELAYLLSDEYTTHIKAQLLPPPLSRPWSVLWRVPKIMRRLQSEFRDLYRRYGERTV